MIEGSISADCTELIAYLGTIKVEIDVIYLTETWMNERRKIINNFPNYNSFEVQSFTERWRRCLSTSMTGA